MKKILTAICAILIFSNISYAANNSLLDSVKQNTQNAAKATANATKNAAKSTANATKNAASSVKKDVQSKTTSNLNKSEYASISVQDQADKLKAAKDQKVANLDKQISAKETQIRNTMLDTKLSVSQKKSKVSLLQKDVNTLKAQKENVVNDYKKQIRELRSY